MSEEQLKALLKRISEDASLKDKLKAAVTIDEAEALAKAEGFDVNKEDWLNFQSISGAELSDADLEGVAGGAEKTQAQSCRTQATNANNCKGCCN